MEFKFSKGDEEGAQAQPGTEKKNQAALLILLLILVGGFSYVYFFTGLIKPQESPKPAEAPVKAQVVKMPLPPSDGGDAKPADTKPADAKKEAPAAPKADPPKASPAPAVAAAPAAKASAPPAVKPKEEPKKAEPAKPKEEPKKAEPVKPKEEPKKAEPAKPADKKPAVAEKKPEPAKADAKKAAVAAVEPKPKAPPVKSEKPAKTESAAVVSGGPWSVLVGSYVLEDALSVDMGKVRKAGLDPVVKPGVRKKTAMNRLFLSEFSDRDAAQTALDKLKRHTSDAFVVEQGGKHAVYAGSYLLDARAASETERLGAAGFQVILKRAEIAIPSQSLTVGPFSDRKSADAALGKMKAAGIKATLTK